MILDRLHTLTHKVPGMPEHDSRISEPARTERPSARRHGQNAHVHHHGRVHTREPHVLVRWQEWIASLGARVEK